MHGSEGGEGLPFSTPINIFYGIIKSPEHSVQVPYHQQGYEKDEEVGRN